MKINPLFLLSCWLLPVQAQQSPSLEDLLKTPLSELPSTVEVSTASRLAQNSSATAAVTYLITAEDIRLYQWQTLAEILQFLPGLYVSQDHDFHYVGVRGLGQPGDFNSRLLFLIDGVRINENIYDAGLVGSDALIDVENIERIEFAAGPGSAVYGNNAFFGVVNIISKGAGQLQGLTTRMSVATDSGTRWHLSGADRLDNGEEWWLSASHQDRPRLQLPFPSPPSLEPLLEANNKEHLSRLRAGAKAAGFRLQALWSEQHRFSPVYYALGDTALLSRTSSHRTNMMISLSHQHSLNDDWQLSGHLNQNQTEVLNSTPLPTADLSLDWQDDMLKGRWLSGDLLLNYQGAEKHDLLFGVELQDDQRQLIDLRLRSNAQAQLSFHGDNRRKSLFMQDIWQFSADQSLLLGLRYDDARAGGHQLSPRLGWVWQPATGQSLKLLYGQAYRAINLFEFANTAGRAAPLPKNEQIRSYELTWQQQFSPTFSYQLSLFYADLQQLIVLDPAMAVFYNAKPIENRGSELNLNWLLNDDASMKLAWSWQRNRTTTGAPLLNSPKHLLKLQYQRNLPLKDLQFSATALANSRKQGFRQQVPGYVSWQLGLHWQAAPDHQLSFQLDNALNQRITDELNPYSPIVEHSERLFQLHWRWQLW